MRLWGAGALAIRKGSLGTRLPVLRERLKCGVNDGDVGVAGYSLFVLGYLGDDPGAKSFLQTQASASGDLGTIAKAALYLTGDTTQKAAVQAGVQSKTVFVKTACAAALGIVDKDDASVNSALISEVKWNEPDDMGGDTGEDGKGMYAVHMLEIVAFDRRGWVYRGNGEGPVTFYGETGSAAGGASGSGGTSGGSSGGAAAGGGTGSATGGATGSGGRSGSGGTTVAAGGSPRSGGSPAAGGATGQGGNNAGNNGGQAAGGADTKGSGGAATSGAGGDKGVGGSNGHGGSSTSSGDTGGKTVAEAQGGDCKCNVGGRANVPAFFFPTLAGLALLLVRRRRH
jgi:hypothetical protein